MKTLFQYIARYRAAKTIETKTKIFNSAMLNLSHEDQQKFVTWHTNHTKN